ncbi:MAG: toxin TcdB middle/N-terminal domain-containing protein, partial [Verrucomicrobiota bacterium]
PWPDALPFPLMVVAQVKVSDSLGHEYVTQFRYHDGYYDPFEKQFRGFAHVEQIDVGDADAPTLVTRSRFDTGREFEAMKGKLLQLTTEQADGRIFWDETTTWTRPPRTLMVGSNGVAVHYAHPLLTTKDILELGNGAPRRLEIESAYDDYGNQIRLADYGIVEGTNRAAFDDERLTLTDFAINLDAWILHKPKRQQTQDESGVVISRSEFYYDDESFSGNNPGYVDRGNLTLRRDWIDPAQSDSFVPANRTKYDAYGNAIAMLDPLSDGLAAHGHYRELVYDDQFHCYPIRETVSVGDSKPPLIFRAHYDQGFGLVASSVDLNGHASRFQYDALARLTAVFKPGDSSDCASTEYRYALGVAVTLDGAANDGRVNYIETRQLERMPALGVSKAECQLITRQFVDGLGRRLMERAEAEPAPGQTAPRVVVNGAVQFNARQQPAVTLNPFFTTRLGTLDELLVDGLHCTWDFKDRLVAVEDELARAEYRYDFSDRRILKRVEWKDRSGSLAHSSRSPWEAVVYPGKHFEVRPLDQPVKYVFNGGTRVARVSGSLSANTRIQRLRLHPGWNLVAVAVTADDVPAQLSQAGPELIALDSLYRWSASDRSWLRLRPEENVPAGTVLWIRCRTNATISLTGITMT